MSDSRRLACGILVVLAVSCLVGCVVMALAGANRAATTCMASAVAMMLAEHIVRHGPRVNTRAWFLRGQLASAIFLQFATRASYALCIAAMLTCMAGYSLWPSRQSPERSNAPDPHAKRRA